MKKRNQERIEMPLLSVSQHEYVCISLYECIFVCIKIHSFEICNSHATYINLFIFIFFLFRLSGWKRNFGRFMCYFFFISLERSCISVFNIIIVVDIIVIVVIFFSSINLIVFKCIHVQCALSLPLFLYRVFNSFRQRNELKLYLNKKKVSRTQPKG